MKTIQLVKSKIHTFFFKEDETKGTFIAFFRIGTSAFILIHLLSIILDFSKLFGKQGIIPHDIRNFLTSDFLISFSKIVSFFEGYGISENIIINGFLITFIFFLLALMFGVCTRFSAFITLFLYKALYSGMYTYGIDAFVVTSLFYLFIFPSGYFYSIDNILFKNRNRKNLNVTLFKRLLQFNVCMVYFYAGASKVMGITWWNGEAVWKSIHLWSANTTFDIDYSFLAENSYLLVVMGWGVLLLETLYPIFIWIPKTRKIWLTGTLLMHIGIGLLLDLYLFAAFLMFWNVTAFYITKPIDVNALVPSFKFLKRKNTSQGIPLEA